MLTAGAAVLPSLNGVKASPALSRNKMREKVRTWEHTLAFPPERPELAARLLANENPYGPSQMARLAIIDSCAGGNRYGHGESAMLREMLAEKEGVSPEHILLGPGSTDILEKTAIVRFLKGGNIVSADPSYMSLIKTAMAFEADWKAVPLTSDYAHDLDAMEKAIDSDTQLVYICNPNNPTGSITDASKLRAFCAKVSEKVPVFVDEAYLEFLPDPEKSSMVDLVREGKDVIIARTFSKIHGMAGLRVGYGVAKPDRLESITDMVRSNMGMSVTSLNAAMASLKDKDFQKHSREWNTEVREYTCEELKKMGFKPIPSYTSFVLFPIEMQGQEFLGKMFEKGVGVRAFEIDDQPYCRVSMGTKEEMELFTSTLKQVLT